jgi:hypothetical protein
VFNNALVGNIILLPNIGRERGEKYMPNEKDLSSTGVVANIWTLNNFEIETTIKLLIQKNVFTK